jgi:hypothetical protein
MWLLAAVAVTTIAVIATVAIVLGGREEQKKPPVAAPKPTPVAAPQKVKFELSNFDPSGDGFRLKDGDTWDSYQYTTVQFGNLKKGIGLALDLGSAKALKSVAFNAKTGPMDVELRSADEMPSSANGWDVVAGSSGSAEGGTKLDASKGGKHRYWLIWVTKLGPERKATITDVSATG